MDEINLEKIDLIIERTKVGYKEAKEALEVCNGNVVDALIYIEEKKRAKKEELYVTKDEFIKWVKDLIEKGNINRIIIRKKDKVIADIPVNAGVAVTGIGLMLNPILTLILFAAALTELTIEITKKDGSVEVVNKVVKGIVKDVKSKFNNKTSNMKDKFSSKDEKYEGNVYSYSVDFDDDDNDINK
ncbi:DUF4342 domain-containing protein [Clostridium cochlearium]|uniref:DUF4342 domain-containing protein n=1 Tax=Clostridium cochlearium TaxID=1494 RepID=A0ABY0QJI6_CLOCO|nr:DUF4342 domain-containing protein [Clostridium cochlearium]MCR1971572.1 DUF4342 domain-containing protein [Clostridium cochlearium]NME94689.1 DUF4342 domain-containing protein [Clostridium cochlearium]SDK97066.1 protein of unknown function [Clostridium cochlearium]